MKMSQQELIMSQFKIVFILIKKKLDFDVYRYNGFKKYFLLHNDRTYDDPVLVVTLPCLCAGAFFFVLGLVGFLKFKSMPLL